MKKYFKYCVKVNNLYVRLVDYGDFFDFTTNEDDAYLFTTFKEALKTIKKLFLDERFAYPTSVLIERVELV